MAAVRLRREVRGRFRAGRGAAGTAGGGSGREGSGAAPEPGRAAGAPLEASHRGLRRRPGAPGSAADARCPPALHSRVPAVRPPRRRPSRPPPPLRSRPAACLGAVGVEVGAGTALGWAVAVPVAPRPPALAPLSARRARPRWEPMAGACPGLPASVWAVERLAAHTAPPPPPSQPPRPFCPVPEVC